jgi:hypothetical protein
MSIFEYFMFCIEHGEWSAPAIVDKLPMELTPTRCDVSGRMVMRGTIQRSAFGVQGGSDAVAVQRTKHGLAFSATQCATLRLYIEKAPAAGFPNSSPATDVCL